MRRILVTAAVVAASLAGAASAGPAWRKLPRAPFPVRQALTGVWTGRQLVVFGRDTAANPAVDVAEAYDPAARSWEQLSPPPGPGYVPDYRAVWTGRQMLVFGAFHSVAFTPASGSWRELPRSLPGGIVVWTGREAIGWGGGCCGDARSDGAAYDPARGAYHRVARSPLAPSQHPVGAWTGRELILVVAAVGPAGKPWPARLARAAAYDPATDRWRRIAPPPDPVPGAAAWDGRELLLVAAGADARSAFAYDPVGNRWRRLAPLPGGRPGATALWTDSRLLVWDGRPGDGLAYDPRADRWARIAPAPLLPRAGSLVVLAGSRLVVWGGGKGVCDRDGVHGCHTAAFADGATFG